MVVKGAGGGGLVSPPLRTPYSFHHGSLERDETGA